MQILRLQIVIRTILKLASWRSLANAAWQTVNVVLAHFKFKDAVRDDAEFRGDQTDAQLHERILELAAEFDVPVADDEREVQRERQAHVVDASYTRAGRVSSLAITVPLAVHAPRRHVVDRSAGARCESRPK